MILEEEYLVFSFVLQNKLVSQLASLDALTLADISGAVTASGHRTQMQAQFKVKNVYYQTASGGSPHRAK